MHGVEIVESDFGLGIGIGMVLVRGGLLLPHKIG